MEQGVVLESQHRDAIVPGGPRVVFPQT
jgi:hypothetical protein